jgi:hypothetical protein
MMRCLQCGHDYPDDQAFCHQCGEPLQARAASPDRRPELGKAELAARRARALSRRRAPARSQSFLFALFVLLGAGAGLAIVWRQAWMPALPGMTVSAPRAQPPQPPDAAPPSAAAPGESAKVESAVPTPTTAVNGATPEPPAPSPAPVVEPPPTAAPPMAVARAPEPAGPTTSPPTPKRGPDAATPRVASRPEPPPPTTDGSRQGAGAASQSGAAPKLLSARTDPGAVLPPSGARVISLIPVGSASRARGQLVWELFGGGTLVVSGLPQPPAGRTYQLWLGSINLGDRVSAGLVAVDAQGAGTLRVAPPRASWSPDIFGVTVERQGGAKEPSDDLVLVGEMPKQTAPPAPATTAPPTEPQSSVPGTDKPSALASAAPAPQAPPPSQPARGPDGQLVRVFSAPVERTWAVTQSVLRSLGWDIDRANQATGVILTEPRNVTYKDFVFYAEGTRHTLSVVVRAVSDTETSISVRREVFQEERILWSKERKVLSTPESAVEQGVLDAIDRVL